MAHHASSGVPVARCFRVCAARAGEQIAFLFSYGVRAPGKHARQMVSMGRGAVFSFSAMGRNEEQGCRGSGVGRAGPGRGP